MPLVPAKCTQCGSNLNVDASQEAAVCPFCHTPFKDEGTELCLNCKDATPSPRTDFTF